MSSLLLFPLCKQTTSNKQIWRRSCLTTSIGGTRHDMRESINKDAPFYIIVHADGERPQVLTVTGMVTDNGRVPNSVKRRFMYYGAALKHARMHDGAVAMGYDDYQALAAQQRGGVQ